MQRMHCWMSLILLASSMMLAGCGSSEPRGAGVDATATSGEHSGAGPAEPVKDTREPKQIFADFVELKRKGNHKEADELLSPKARDVTQRVAISVFNMPPDGSLQCEIKDAEKIGPNAMHVETLLTEGFGERAVQRKMLWVMRDDGAGWRIIGTILPAIEKVFAEPTALDFEDEQQMRSFKAYLISLEQGTQAKTPSEQQPPMAETAAKPSAGSTKQ